MHEKEFEIVDEEAAYINTAKIFALATYGLLKDGARRGKEIKRNYKPIFDSVNQYLEYMEQVN